MLLAGPGGPGKLNGWFRRLRLEKRLEAGAEGIPGCVLSRCWREISGARARCFNRILDSPPAHLQAIPQALPLSLTKVSRVSSLSPPLSWSRPLPPPVWTSAPSARAPRPQPAIRSILCTRPGLTSPHLRPHRRLLTNALCRFRLQTAVRRLSDTRKALSAQPRPLPESGFLLPQELRWCRVPSSVIFWDIIFHSTIIDRIAITCQTLCLVK